MSSSSIQLSSSDSGEQQEMMQLTLKVNNEFASREFEKSNRYDLDKSQLGSDEFYGVKQQKSVTSEWETNKSAIFSLSNFKGLDYGTGMAYSYYYGYLRLILPSTGTTTKGIVEKIENFEDKHGVTFPVHKLFILIPSSGYIPPDLKEVSEQWMESAQLLEEEKRNRAGNIGRTYRNNVYKIYPGGRKSDIDPIYVAAEGATPLLTFYEVQKHDHPEAPIYKQFKHEIIATFHMKLHNILQNELDTKDLCELIHYDDYEPDGTKVNIAQIILERISKLRRST